MIWQYLQENLPTAPQLKSESYVDERLQELGKQGWECFHVIKNYNSGHDRFFFKRMEKSK